MDFPTDEDLYELQHQDELDALDDIEDAYPYEGFNTFMYGNRSSAKENNSFIINDQNSSSSLLAPKTSNSENSLNKAENQNVLAHSDSERNKNDAGNLPTKRRLQYSPVFESDIDEDGGDLEIDLSVGNLSSQTDKRKSCIFDDDDVLEVQTTAKKRCIGPESPVKATHSEPAPSSQLPLPPVRESVFLRDSIPLTKADGRRIYFYLKEDPDEKKNFQTFSQRTSSLLPTPIAILKSQYFLLEERFLKESQNVQNSSQMDVSSEVEVINDENKENSLWVEKYRPISYMHLLSEEGINRTLLQWLKLWDKAVFGREKKTKKKPAEPKNPTQNKFKKTFGELIEDLDDHGRPHHKVAFLSGPPGLGKTTLATIIAKHAGYNVVEINASDDRNPEAFRTSLEAATQMKSVLQQDHRPNCLVLDEIDGAPAASINVLISFIKSTGIPKGAKRKKGDIPLLVRPLICICNDQYSAALKPLRQLALVLNFPTTRAARLASRLNEVSSKEGLRADMTALTLLCEKTGNDIRSCLSTLQFLHRKKNELKVSDLEGLQIGQKDMQKSLFAVWQDIFYFKDKKSFSGIRHTIQAFGDYDKIYIGMFENYVNMKFKHRNLEAVWQGSEWSCFGDILQQQISERQLYFLMPYLPYPAVAFHMLFATNSFTHISYPTAFYEQRAKTFQLASTLTSVIKDMITSLKTFLNPSVLLLDVFPFLVEIIKPNLRPVNTQLYSEREKSELRRVIELMIAFNLSYHQERSQDGTYNYLLDPDIEGLIRFNEIKPKKVLTYSTKQMIAREVEMEQMRKGDSRADQIAEQLSSKDPKKKAPEPPKPVQKKKEKIEERPVLDFFGRKVIPKPKDNATEEQNKLNDQEVWFHFKEGYSNAVRRNVYIKDLM